MSDYSNLSDKELLELYKTTQNTIAANRNAEQAIKISINAAYGALGNQYFKYYDVRLAEAITSTGQAIIKWGDKYFNDYYVNTLKFPEKDYVIYCDTDSLYVDTQPLVDKFCKGKSEDEIVEFLDKVCKTKLRDLFANVYRDFYDYTNGFEYTINFKREAICSKGFFSAKKKYVVRVHDNEGVRYAIPENKVTGLQIIQSSTPAMVKNTLRECVDIILSGSVDDLRSHVDKVKAEFFSSSAEDIASPRGVNNIIKYMAGGKLYKPACPIAVRGSILHNYYVKQLKLEQKYANINGGDKIKFVYLKQQNPMRENVISFTKNFPEEVVDRRYVDHTKQFDTVFMSALDIMLKTIDWELYPKLTLDEFFC